MSVLFWVLLAIGLAVIEILSVTFFPIFFSFSALLALGVYLADGEDWLQWLVFGVGGLVFSAGLRPIAKRQLEKGPDLKNPVEEMTGQRGVVEVPVDGRSGTGTVRLGGQVWTARPEDAFGQIGAGTDVEVKEVRGATIVVAPLDQ
ncbi:MAG: NfeD family protein [Solirubrobacteraceae bacterium]|nr:NfeD family protein [Solirubrobacteraceae bacterium]